jgi:hypothetical protein
MRKVNNNDSDTTFTYETDDLSVSQWRSIMLVCQAYEKCLLNSQGLSNRSVMDPFLS